MNIDQAKQSQPPIEFTATVNKVQTMVDGGLRVILDFSEDCVMQAAQLMECKRFGVPLIILAKPAETEETLKKPKKSYV